jgi:hypothetical protein
MLTAMFCATTVLLASMTAATVPAGRLASTYDEAACANDSTPPAAPLDQVDCSIAPPPAVIDCSEWQELQLIGTCDDMPRSAGAPTVARAQNGGAPSRTCDGIHCGDRSSPLRPAAPGGDEGRPLAVGTMRLSRFASVTALWVPDDGPLYSVSGRRIERPPRNFR